MDKKFFNVTGLPVGAAVDIACEARGNAEIYTLSLKTEGEALDFASMRILVGANASEAVGRWFPESDVFRGVKETWCCHNRTSYMCGAPVQSYYRTDDVNLLTVAVDDTITSWNISSGIEEENRMLNYILSPNGMKTASKVIRVFVDRSHRKYYDAVRDVVSWWAELDGGAHVIPESAYDPVYSTWYAFHRDITAETVLEQCKMAAELGCKTVFIDDGWATPLDTVGYNDTGDWKPHPDRFPDIKSFVDSIHALGMKAVLWAAPGLSGCNARSSKLYAGKFMKENTNSLFNVLDPRYTFVRSGMINDTCELVTNYNFDGLKIDFIDSIQGADCEPDDERDYSSVTDALHDMLDVIYGNITKAKPDALIEFRQAYVGRDILRTANIVRAGDCAQDFLTNRVRVIDLRLGTNVAVHSDMIQIIEDEAPESSALQLTNIMFSTPQISPCFDKISDEQKRMLKFWIGFMSEKRELLQKSSFEPKHCYNNYSSVTVRNESERLTTLYGESLLILDETAPRVYIVNAYERTPIYVGSSVEAKYAYKLVNCMGDDVGSGEITLDSSPKLIEAPFNGMIVMDLIK
ncbi:MAG: glycosyl hydrolase [Clostridiales bacterium]|nr:glycosyl hydrolase [Clostridiales bacterium]